MKLTTTEAAQDTPITNTTSEITGVFKAWMDEAGLTDGQQERIKEMGFFEAPASSQYHLCKPGGLAEHTSNVITTALKIRDAMALPLERKAVIGAALFHDFGKMQRYKPNILKSGLQSTAKPYVCEPEMALPDCTDSLYVIMNELGIKLDPLVITGIIWQNGAFDYQFKTHLPTLAKRPEHMMMAWLIHTADMYSAWIVEREEEKEGAG